MKPIEVLMYEHRVIERVLSVLDRAVNKLERGQQIDMVIFADVIEFVRNFADKLHHGKEEGQLFPLMAERGGESGLIEVMLADHAQGRVYVREMADAVQRYEQGDTTAKTTIISRGVSYIDLLRGHIDREDTSLFRQADEIFSLEDQQTLGTELERVEAELFAPGEHERYLKLVTKLEGAVS